MFRWKNLNNIKLNLIEKVTNFICEKLVRRKIKNQFGGKLRAFVSGGGALDKKIGEFFEPITMRAASRVSMNYKLPSVK